MRFQRVCAFDLEHSLVRRARRRLPGRFRERISFFTGDAQDLPFADSVFDGGGQFWDYTSCSRLAAMHSGIEPRDAARRHFLF